MKNIFENSLNHFLISPFISNERPLIESAWNDRGLNNHIFLMSSGTTSKDTFKTFAISKEAILANASAVNERFDINSKDRWLCSLPEYHIGGLSIHARAYLSNSTVVEYNQRWSAELLVKTIQMENIHFLSLVPTQLYDIVKLKLKAPRSVKAVFIGGDFASNTLCKMASDLGWPLLMTYGMSELSSQIATSPYKNIIDGFIEVFPIHQLNRSDLGIIIDSPSLFTEKISISKHGDVVVESNENFILPDQVDISTQGEKLFIKPLGRSDDVFKISGRLFHLNQIRDVISSDLIKRDLFSFVHLTTISDDRLGKKIQVNFIKNSRVLVDELKDIMQNNLSVPTEYFTFKAVEAFSKTSLGKIKKP